jgi:NADH:ubiquinone oxidoreductase subunit F (NADH-binding)
VEIVDQFIAGQGSQKELDELSHLADVMQLASFCGLGQAVAIPVKSALRHFGEVFLDSQAVK